MLSFRIPHPLSVLPVLKRGRERRLIAICKGMIERVQTGPLVLRHLQSGLHRFQRQLQRLCSDGLHAPPQHLRSIIVPLCFPVGLRQKQVPLRYLRRLLQGPLQIVNGRRPVSLFRLSESLLPQVSRLVLPIRAPLVRGLCQFLRMADTATGGRRTPYSASPSTQDARTAIKILRLLTSVRTGRHLLVPIRSC